MGLTEALLEVGADGLDELGAVEGLSLNAFHQVHEVLGYNTEILSDCRTMTYGSFSSNCVFSSITIEIFFPFLRV